jgi:tetratricopeptide (TPR) repeat protein
MRWMTKLDRALSDMTARAARDGGEEARRVREVVAGVIRLDPRRLTSYFHVGYAEVLLGLESSELMPPPVNEVRERWWAFGRLAALVRERRWEEAAALAGADVSLRMARDPQIAPEAMPMAVDALLRAEALVAAVELAWAYVRPDKPEEMQYFRQVAQDAILRLPIFRRLEPRAPDELNAAVRCSSVDDSEAFLRHLADKESWQEALGPVASLVLHGLGRSAALRFAFDDAVAVQAKAEAALPPTDPLRPVAAAHRALSLLRVRLPGELRPGADVRPNLDRAKEALDFAAAPPIGRPSVTGLYALGVIAREEGRHAEADDLFASAAARLREAAVIDGGSVAPWVKFERAQSLLRAKPAPSPEDVRAAGGLLREALEHVRPGPDELRRIADALEGFDEPRRREILIRIPIEDVDQVEGLVRLSADLLHAGEAQRALTAAERALILAARPDHRAQALRAQLRALARQGRNDEAADVYERLREHCLERGLLRELRLFVEGEGREFGLVTPRERLLVLAHLGRVDPEAFLPAGRTSQPPGPSRLQVLVELVELYLASHEEEDLASAQELVHEIRVQDEARAGELAARLAAQSGARGIAVVPPAIPDLAAHLRTRFPEPIGLVVVGGAERDRELFERFGARGSELGYRSTWVPAWYDDPRRTIDEGLAAVAAGCRGLLVLQWNRRVVRETLSGRAEQSLVLVRRFDFHGFQGLWSQARLLLGQLVQRHAVVGT